MPRPRRPVTVQALAAPPAEARRVYCNRTLNLRSIRALGFDMDYTLVHYRPEVWERRAFEHAQQGLVERGYPVADLTPDLDLVMPGLVLDLEAGTVVKANRFGWVTRAMRGRTRLSLEEQRRLYARVLVDLAEPRWVFLNTLFSLSEGALWVELMDRLHQGKVAPGLGPRELYRAVKECLDAAHLETAVKAEVMRDPAAHVVDDPELARALLDFVDAGKRLLLVTNSEWSYTQAMMEHAVGRFLPAGRSWRSLFELVIVGARKPEFFSGRAPAFEVVDERGWLRPVVGQLEPGRSYQGGNAMLLEQSLGVTPEEILYVGDHPFADVHVSKDLLRWRTALILRALEGELQALESFRARERELASEMREKEGAERRLAQTRLAQLRHGRGEPLAPGETPRRLQAEVSRLHAVIAAADARIAPLAAAASELHNPHWGLLFRAGNDKSLLARQVERYADVYTSRVSNLLLESPFAMLRAPRSPMPHDP